MGAKWSFGDDRNALMQKISLRQTEILPPPIPVIIPTPEDQRLRTRTPSKTSDEEMIRQMLQPYVDRGLHLSFSDGLFHMKHGIKTDSGTMRQPPRVILNCAKRLME